MEYVILGLLIIQSMTIYDLRKSFQAGISLFYSDSLGSMQSSIKKMKEDGRIVYTEMKDSGRKKKLYSATLQGKEAFFEWMKSEIPKNSKMESQILSRFYFLGLLKDKEQKKEVIRKMIAAAEESRQNLTDVKTSLETGIPGLSVDPVFRYQLKTLEYGIVSHGAGIDFFLNELSSLDSFV